MTDLQTFDAISITMINDEPRVRDLDLGVALGFARPAKIRELVERYSEKLSEFGVLPTVGKTSGALGGRPTTEFFLNRKQALFLCAKSETELAFEVTAAMVRLFDAALEGPRREIVRAPQTMEEALELALAQHRELKAKAAEIAVLAPKAEVADRIAEGDEVVSLAHAAKNLNVGPRALNDLLLDGGILFRDARGNLIPYQIHVNTGRFVVRQSPYRHPKTGEARYSATTLVTQKGIVWLAERLAPASSARPVATLPLLDRAKRGGR